MKYAIELDEDEVDLLAGIELDALKMDHEQYRRQSPLVQQLTKKLMDRRAIPEVRLRYWSDPDYQLGRLKTSHQGLFERNGTRGDDIIIHPHFLKYLRYFLFGASLSENVIVAFEETVGDPQWVSSGDIDEIAKGTRGIVRKFGQQGEDEEFYKLALDIGLHQWFAKVVRDAAKQTK